MASNLTAIDWAKRPLQRYADLTGRAPRSEYWWYALVLAVAFLVINFVENLVGLGGMIGDVYGPIFLLLWLATIVPSIAVGVRRLHDTDRSGWWLLLCAPYALSALLTAEAARDGSITDLGAPEMLAIAGLIGAIALLVFMVLPGTPGPNRFGPDPYGRKSLTAEG